MIIDPIIQYEDLPLFRWNPSNRRILQKVGSLSVLGEPLPGSSDQENILFGKKYQISFKKLFLSLYFIK